MVEMFVYRNLLASLLHFPCTDYSKAGYIWLSFVDSEIPTADFHSGWKISAEQRIHLMKSTLPLFIFQLAPSFFFFL